MAFDNVMHMSSYELGHIITLIFFGCETLITFVLHNTTFHLKSQVMDYLTLGQSLHCALTFNDTLNKPGFLLTLKQQQGET